VFGAGVRSGDGGKSADGASGDRDRAGRDGGGPGAEGALPGGASHAALYAGFGDFALWRIRPVNGLFVGGFARAARLRAADLTPDPAAVAAIAAAEADIIAHCNADHPDAMAAIARAAGAWRMVAVDVDGCDLAQGEHVVRVAWAAPVGDPGDVRRELIRLAHAARG
jgi:putative heme iron utilization protein